MELRDITIRLALGELKNTNLIDPNDKSTIKEEHRLMVINAIQEGLDNIFSKYVMSTKEVVINKVQNVTQYYLRKEFAQSNTDSVVPLKYIDDTVGEEFTNNVISILRVVDEDGNEIPLNDEDDDKSIFTLEFDCLQITNVHNNQEMGVMYQARHKVIDPTNPIQVINLPIYMIEALKNFAAGKILMNMNGKEHVSNGMIYLSLFEQNCAEAESKGLVKLTSVNNGCKLDNRGFK